MEETNEGQTQTDISTDTPVEEGKLPQAVVIEKRVKEILAGSVQRVNDDVVNILVQKTIDERVRLLDEKIKVRQQRAKELNAIKPDVVNVDADGKKVQELYSPATQKKLIEARQKLQKIDKILNAAIENGDYSKLNEIQ